MKQVLSFLFVLYWTFTLAQTQTFSIRFEPTYAAKPVVLNNLYILPNGNDSFQINLLKFYVSNIALVQTDSIVFTNPNFYLVDAQNRLSIYFDIPENIQFNALELLIGIDSTIQENSPLSGDLDPINGMYWTWQSGYIHYKLEGKCSACLNNNKQFTFHIGGYQGIDATQYKLSFNLPTNHLSAQLSFDVFAFLPNMDVAKECKLMLPGAKAKLYAQEIKKSWKLKK
ncbi:MAG: hypothetical protein Q8R57_05075 [Bacteroidota bacterium]|nr:hypothetical protein [Bacteroidota bacterium]